MQEYIVFLQRVQCRRKESSRSLSHLLMSFLLSFALRQRDLWHGRRFQKSDWNEKIIENITNNRFRTCNFKKWKTKIVYKVPIAIVLTTYRKITSNLRLAIMSYLIDKHC